MFPSHWVWKRIVRQTPALLQYLYLSVCTINGLSVKMEGKEKRSSDGEKEERKEKRQLWLALRETEHIYKCVRSY